MFELKGINSMKRIFSFILSNLGLKNTLDYVQKLVLLSDFSDCTPYKSINNYIYFIKKALSLQVNIVNLMLFICKC